MRRPRIDEGIVGLRAGVPVAVIAEIGARARIVACARNDCYWLVSFNGQREDQHKDQHFYPFRRIRHRNTPPNVQSLGSHHGPGTVILILWAGFEPRAPQKSSDQYFMTGRLGVGGSNPLAPTNKSPENRGFFLFLVPAEAIPDQEPDGLAFPA